MGQLVLGKVDFRWLRPRNCNLPIHVILSPEAIDGSRSFCSAEPYLKIYGATMSECTEKPSADVLL